MTIRETLKKAGLGLAGTPPAGTIEVGGRVVRMTVEEAKGLVRLRAELAASPDASPAALLEAGLSAAGDTVFSYSSGSVSGTRTLAEPTAGAAYDAVFDLAKATCSLALMLDALADLLGMEDAVPAVDAELEPVAPAARPRRRTAAAPTVAPPPQHEPAAAAVSPVFAPTHRVPAGGLAAWTAPGQGDPVATIGAGLLVELAEQHANGWTRVVCENTWAGWVDGRRLEPLAG